VDTAGVGHDRATKTCSSTDGSALHTPTGICTCGSGAGVQVPADEYCLEALDGSGVALTSAACANTDGSVTGTACSCGSNEVAVSDTQYCLVTPSTGLGAMKAAAAVPATTCAADTCTSSDDVALTAACSCATSSDSNECAVGKFCYGATCEDAAKPVDSGDDAGAASASVGAAAVLLAVVAARFQ